MLLSLEDIEYYGRNIPQNSALLNPLEKTVLKFRRILGKIGLLSNFYVELTLLVFEKSLFLTLSQDCRFFNF